MLRRFVPGGVIVLLLSGVVALATHSATAQEMMKRGESVFTDATPVDLGSGLIPAYPSLPAAIGLQRLTIAPGGHVDTPSNDPRLVFFVVEQGTLTVRNTVPAVVTRATGKMDTMPADADFTMGPGDATVSGPGSGGVLRNDGTGDVTLLAAIIWPVGAGTPGPAATPSA
jgi:mannose-6-phosphate isomerase-like protein (cupin superfamily)